MRIKKFTASNYADALEQVKGELGDDALIMSTRSIKPDSPLSGRNAATKVEITAAVEFKESSVSNFEEELDLDEEKGLDIKSLIFNLLSEKSQAQTLGIKSSQFGTRQHFRQFYHPSIRDLVAINFEFSLPISHLFKCRINHFFLLL